MEIPNILGKNSIIDVRVNVKFTVRHCELWPKNETYPKPLYRFESHHEKVNIKFRQKSSFHLSHRVSFVENLSWLPVAFIRN